MEPSDLDLFWAVACDVSLLLTRSDDFRRSQHESGDYVSWLIEHSYVVVPAQLDPDQASRHNQQTNLALLSTMAELGESRLRSLAA